MATPDEIITDLNTLCGSCGFFDSESTVNNGYGCLHKECGDGEFLDSNENYVENTDSIIAMSLTKRNIKCSRRLAKKFMKKVSKMSFEEQKKHLAKKGIKYYGKCFPFSCPISYTVGFESIDHYVNGKDYDYIENEEDMPEGWGDDLMALDVKDAEKMGINT